MHPILLILASAILTATQAFQFTGPTTAEKLDLTKPITVSWDATGGTLSAPTVHALDLWFRAFIGDNNSDRAGWKIAANLSLANSNSYEWHPSSILKLVQDNDQKLSPDAVHTFEARLLGQDGKRLTKVESDEYAVNGFDSIGDSKGNGARVEVCTAATAIVAAGIVVAF